MPRRRRKMTHSREGMDAIKRRITSVDNLDAYVKGLFYGDNGTGKTRLAATGPKPLIVDMTEKGTRSIRGSGAKAIIVEKWDDLGHLYWLLHSGKHPFQTVALDTLDGMYRLAMEKVLHEADERDPSRPSKQPSQRDFGRANQLFISLLLSFRDLPVHVVMLAHERVQRDEDTGEVIDITVNLPGQARSAAMDSVGILGYMEPKPFRERGKGGKRTKPRWRDRLITGRDPLLHTKDKTGVLPAVLRDPTMPQIIEAWASSPEQTEGE